MGPQIPFSHTPGVGGACGLEGEGGPGEVGS